MSSANKKLREMRQTARRIFFDSSTPPTWTVIRVVLIAFASWYLASFLINILIALQSLIFLLILSVFFAYLLNPLIEYIQLPFERHNLQRFMPRTLAIGIIYLVFFLSVALVIAALVPRVSDQARRLAINVPIYAESVRAEIQELSERYENYKILENVQLELNKKINEIAADAAGSITGFLSDAAISIVTYLPWLIIVPIFSFFFLKDANTFKVWVLRAFPPGKWRSRAEAIMEDINNTLSAYIRAQLVSCLLIGLICTSGFYAFGINYSLLLGILAGIFEFIPLIGPLTIGLIATLITGITDSLEKAIYIAVFLIILRIIHDYVTYPRIVKGGVHLPPIVIILSVLVGEKLAGIPGVFLSIPIAALITVFYRHALEHTGNTGFLNRMLNEQSPKLADPNDTTSATNELEKLANQS